MRTNQKSKLRSLISLLFVIYFLMFTSCFNPAENDTGTLTINFGSSSARALWTPPGVSDVSQIDHTIIVTDNSGIPQQKNNIKQGSGAVSFDVALGPCQIVVKAYYGGTLVAEGFAKLDIVTGTNSVPIQMTAPGGRISAYTQTLSQGVVTTTFSIISPQAGSVDAPLTGDNYKITLNGSEISTGSVTVSGIYLTFHPTTSGQSDFAGSLSGGLLRISSVSYSGGTLNITGATASGSSSGGGGGGGSGGGVGGGCATCSTGCVHATTSGCTGLNSSCAGCDVTSCPCKQTAGTTTIIDVTDALDEILTILDGLSGLAGTNFDYTDSGDLSLAAAVLDWDDPEVLALKDALEGLNSTGLTDPDVVTAVATFKAIVNTKIQDAGLEDEIEAAFGTVELLDLQTKLASGMPAGPSNKALSYAFAFCSTAPTLTATDFPGFDVVAGTASPGGVVEYTLTYSIGPTSANDIVYKIKIFPMAKYTIMWQNPPATTAWDHTNYVITMKYPDGTNPGTGLYETKLWNDHGFAADAYHVTGHTGDYANTCTRCISNDMSYTMCHVYGADGVTKDTTFTLQATAGFVVTDVKVDGSSDTTLITGGNVVTFNPATPGVEYVIYVDN